MRQEKFSVTFAVYEAVLVAYFQLKLTITSPCRIWAMGLMFVTGLYASKSALLPSRFDKP